MSAARSAMTAALVTALVGCTVVEEQPIQVVPEKVPEEVVVNVPPPPPPPTPAPPPPQVARMNEIDAPPSDFERLRRLPPVELAREQESARQGFNQLRTENARLRLGMALGVPGLPGTEERALEVLEPLVKNPSSSLHG